jgi:DNA polymerase
MIVENQTQAAARDLMAAAMLRAERHGTYEVVLSVHDELIAEAPANTGSVHEFEQLMSECPQWAWDCPVSTEGWKTSTRYRK